MSAIDHYCVLADVNKLAAQAPFSSSSKPTDQVVTELIEDEANDLDSVLANAGYTVPVVTGAKALLWLRRTCAFGALGMAQTIRDTGVKTAVTAGGREGKNIWLQLRDQRLRALTDGNDLMELSDAPRTNQQIEKQGESVLRSSVQSVTDFGWTDDVEVTRDQVL